MTKRLLSWLLVLSLLVGICVTALADEPTIPDGGGCAHSYAIVKGPRVTSYSTHGYSNHYKYVRQLRKCAYCASTVYVDVESPKLEDHTWVISSKELVGSRYHVIKDCSLCHQPSSMLNCLIPCEKVVLIVPN